MPGQESAPRKATASWLQLFSKFCLVSRHIPTPESMCFLVFHDGWIFYSLSHWNITYYMELCHKLSFTQEPLIFLWKAVDNDVKAWCLVIVPVIVSCWNLCSEVYAFFMSFDNWMALLLTFLYIILFTKGTMHSYSVIHCAIRNHTLSSNKKQKGVAQFLGWFRKIITHVHSSVGSAWFSLWSQKRSCASV